MIKKTKTARKRDKVNQARQQAMKLYTLYYNKNIMCIDIGTTSGVFINTPQQVPIQSRQVIELKQHKVDGEKFNQFENQIKFLLDGFKINLVIFEDVKRHLSHLAAMRYGGLLAILQKETHLRKIPLLGCPVKHAKIAMTGSGNATKDDMLFIAQKRLYRDDLTEDEADAYGLFTWWLGLERC